MSEHVLTTNGMGYFWCSCNPNRAHVLWSLNEHIAEIAAQSSVPAPTADVTWTMPREDARDLLRWLRHNRPLGMPDSTFDGLTVALTQDREPVEIALTHPPDAVLSITVDDDAPMTHVEALVAEYREEPADDDSLLARIRAALAQDRGTGRPVDVESVAIEIISGDAVLRVLPNGPAQALRKGDTLTIPTGVTISSC